MSSRHVNASHHKVPTIETPSDRTVAGAVQLRLPLLARVVAALVAGAFLWLAFPRHNLWWLAPVGVALFSLALTSARRRTGTLLGFLTGLTFFLPTLSWSGVYVGPGPWIALATLQALYFALAGCLVAHLSPVRPATWMTGAVWVVAEWLRSTTPFGGFPWARLAFSQADAWWAPIIAWVSAPGLTFLIAAVGGALARMLWHLMVRLRLGPTADAPRQWGSVFAAIPVIALAAGVFVSPSTSGRPVTVAAVQGNVPKAGLDFNAERMAVLRNHASATNELARRVQSGSAPRPDLVVWPENSSDIDPLRNPDAQQLITDAVRAVETPTIVGAVLSEPRPNISNAALLYDEKGQLRDRYVKQHPVPFGEFIPYRSFFRTFSHQVDLVRADFVQGQHVGMFTVGSGAQKFRIAPVICFEVAYDDLLRKPANQGAEIFAVPTNNATFGYTDESYQQLAISRLRALEYGRSIVHISTVGASALITPDGVAHQQSDLFTQAVLNGKLPLRAQPTIAQLVGRAPEILATAGLAVALVVFARRRKSSGPAVR